MSEIIHGADIPSGIGSPGCKWAVEGFPKGPALLSCLYAQLQEADPCAAPLVRFLFLSALQPYMQHMRSWMYTTASVAPNFAAAPGDVDTAVQQLPGNSVSCTLCTLLSLPPLST